MNGSFKTTLMPQRPLLKALCSPFFLILALQSVVFDSLVVPETILGNLQGKNYFHTTIEM